MSRKSMFANLIHAAFIRKENYLFILHCRENTLSIREDLLSKLKTKFSVLHSLQRTTQPEFTQVNNGNTKTLCETCSKLNMKITERRNWLHFEQVNVGWERIKIYPQIDHLGKYTDKVRF